MEKTIKERVADILALPKDAGGVSTVINITDMQEAVIDGYKGIIEFTENIVRLNTPKYIIKIEGADLEIKEVAAEYIAVRGIIKSVEYQK